MSLFSGAAQGAKPIAPVVLLERWVLTKPWQPYWALVDPATSDLKILPCMALTVFLHLHLLLIPFRLSKGFFRFQASMHCFSWESTASKGKDFILAKPRISSKGSKDRRRYGVPQQEKPEQVDNSQMENLTIDWNYLSVSMKKNRIYERGQRWGNVHGQCRRRQLKCT